MRPGISATLAATGILWCGLVAAQPIEISGVVFTATGDIIPAASTIEVRLVDVTDASNDAVLVTSFSTTLDDPQNTREFTLSHDLANVNPANRYALQARVTGSGGTLLFVSKTPHPVIPVTSIYGFSVVVSKVNWSAESADGLPPVPIGKSFEFDCDGNLFVVRFGPGEMAMWLPDEFGGEYLVLSRDFKSEGARFVEGSVVFWNRDGETLIDIEDYQYRNCREVGSQ